MVERNLNGVILADRHLVLTEGVSGLLETCFELVVRVADETALVECADRLQPLMAVVDVSLSPEGGLRWLRTLKERCPGVKVVALSVHDEPSVRRSVLAAGADAFVVKRDIATDLLPAVESILAAALQVGGRPEPG